MSRWCKHADLGDEEVGLGRLFDDATYRRDRRIRKASKKKAKKERQRAHQARKRQFDDGEA